MDIKKRVIIGIFFVLVFLIFIDLVSALRVSPAKKEYNFYPNLEQTITYTVLSNNNRELNLYLGGELSKYITLDRDNLPPGGGQFTATLRLPSNMSTPGKNRILIGVEEVFDEELAGTFIGTSIAIQVVIYIYVPYPGQYIDIGLTSRDANVGEMVNFELEVISQGKENVDISPIINIYNSNSQKIETLHFQNRIIESQETLNLKKSLDTTNYNPGNYRAEAVIDYGALAKSESDFRIGDLSIDIINYTNKLPIKKLEPFEIGIESGWNDNIKGAYAQIILLDQLAEQEIENIKTSPTDLTPWETKTIVGYIETIKFEPGVYDANITLNYFGDDQRKLTSKIVKVEFVKYPNMLVWYIVGGVGLLIIIILGVRYFKKNGKKKK